MKKITLALLTCSFLSTQSSFSMLAWFQEHKVSLTVTATALTTGAYGYFGIIRPLQKDNAFLKQALITTAAQITTLTEEAQKRDVRLDALETSHQGLQSAFFEATEPEARSFSTLPQPPHQMPPLPEDQDCDRSNPQNFAALHPTNTDND